MKKILVALSLVTLSFSALAAEKKKSEPKTKAAAHTELTSSRKFDLTITYGDKVTIFEVAKEKKGGVLRFSNNEGESKITALSEKDMTYLMSEVDLLKKSNDLNLCDIRSYMVIHEGKRTIYGCLGSSTPTAKRMTDLANLFSGIVRL